MKQILGKTLTELKRELVNNNFSDFRAEQIYNWLYKNLISQPKKMTNIPEVLQTFLQNNYIFTIFNLEEVNEAQDGTLKFLWKTKDKNYLESVLIPQDNSENKYTACLSSQIGCSLGCKFCASGISGKTRDLSCGEIVEQLWQMANYLESQNGHIRNIVFMGMGEPFLNYEALKKSLNIFIEEKGFNIGRRRITVSTSGIIPGIYSFAEDFTQVGLAISLHSADNKIRSELVPINQKYPLQDLKEALDYYFELTGRRITLEYIVFENKNDGKQDMIKLKNFCSGFQSHINLIKANPVPELGINSTSHKNVVEFKKLLENSGLSVSIRKSRGKNKNAACGQLRINQEGR